MSEQKRRIASDGWVARESGEWAEEKLYYLERYFYAFNQATKKSFDRRAYVDLLAGPGRCYLKDIPEKEFAGSPLLALTAEAPFSSVLCVEGEARNAEALRHRIAGCERASTATVLQGNANAPETIARVRDALAGRKTLGLIFVDTLGLSDVAFTTLQEITRGRRADLIYTFHVSDVTRNIGEALSNDHEAARFTEAFGHSDWDAAWEAHVRGLAGTVDVADALTTFFELRLQEGLGYPYVKSLHRLMKNSRNAPLYRLILASHSALAPKLWQGVTKIEFGGQRGLF
jgi:three-Cys-motif partner protein